MPSPAVAKALRRLEASLQAGECYEAQQVVKTVYYRMRSRKAAGLEDGYQLLQEAAVMQLRIGQARMCAAAASSQVISDSCMLQDSCGAELGTLLLQALCEDRALASLERVSAVCAILQAFPDRASPRASELTPELAAHFAQEALKWLRLPSSGEADAACSRIHLLLAQYLFAFCGAEGLGWASPHFALGHEESAFAAAVADAVSQAGQHEHLFVARACLQILAASSYAPDADAGSCVCPAAAAAASRLP